MNIIHRYILLTVSVSVFISCKKNDWFEEKVDQSQNIPANLNDLRLLMNNHDLLNVETPALQEWASDGHSADLSIFPFLGSNSANAYTWSNDIPYSNVLEWSNGNSGAYLKVFYSNLVLEKLNDILPVNVEENGSWNNIKGQALFVRAKSFFDLAQVFAPPYTQKNLHLLSVPLRVESDVNIRSKRSTVAETYDLIIHDLLMAKQLLLDTYPSNPLLKSTPSKIAVDALLARVYLTMEDYDKALLYSDSCLNKYNKLMNFNFVDSTLSLPFPLFNDEIIYYSIMSLSMNPQFTFVDSKLIDKYKQDDLRKAIFFDKTMGDGFVRFKGTYDSYSGTVFSGLATDEIFLIRAECNARKNNTSLAMEDLNTLLSTRWKSTVPYEPIVANSSEEALKIILNEREKELFFRGIRWSDLRRLNNDPRFEQTFSREYNGKTYTLEPNSYKYTFPIPDDVIRATGMEQNIGWHK